MNCNGHWMKSLSDMLWYDTCVIHNSFQWNIFWQVRAVLLVTYQWTQSATESLIVNCRGSVQVTTVCLVVDRWLFSPTLDVRQTTVNSLSGWVLPVQTSRTGSGLWDHGGRRLIEVKFRFIEQICSTFTRYPFVDDSCFVAGLYYELEVYNLKNELFFLYSYH